MKPLRALNNVLNQPTIAHPIKCENRQEALVRTLKNSTRTERSKHAQQWKNKGICVDPPSANSGQGDAAQWRRAPYLKVAPRFRRILRQADRTRQVETNLKLSWSLSVPPLHEQPSYAETSVTSSPSRSFLICVHRLTDTSEICM